MSNKVNSQLLLWDLRFCNLGSRSVKSSSHLCVSRWSSQSSCVFEFRMAITRLVIVRFHRFDQTKQWARFRSCLPVLVGLVRRSRSKFGRWFCRVSHEWVSDAVGGWLVLIKHLSARLFHYACLQLASQLWQCLFLRQTNQLASHVHVASFSANQKTVGFSWNSLFNFEDVQLLRLRDFF